MDYQKLPTRTFIPKHVGDARQNWYKTRKKPMLDKLDARIKAPDNFTILDVKRFITDIEKLIEKKGNLAVCFGAETEGKADFVLLFAGIKKWFNLPNGYFLLNKEGRLEEISVEEGNTLRNNYQNGIQPVLGGSTGDGDIETEYVFFDQETITEILGEFQYQTDKDRISGLKVQLVSYADKEAEVGFPRSRDTQPKYLERLSIMFTYTKDGRDTSFEEIDPERYEDTRRQQEKDKSGLNTGSPIPPPPPRNPDPVK
ncbi:hypothetical protein FXV77_14830 [Sphingobacterium phlebotomi]|uniref:Uncharacterized protein n=1 Tax=Sphingobacterium phlebotomi TaxID=2605433 RepID=A0A5D4H384_9SPHI|nr:hypothetical protein [Sphingobacterium phlebotomi]TYR34742.1 hypothetical protein FXV77_14830 [Sphingobacterium phlebotomi]